MAAFDTFSELKPKQFTGLKIRMLPKTKGADTFHREKPKVVNVRLDNRNAINRFLAEDFVKGNIKITDYAKIMAANMVDAKHYLAVHLSNTVPEEFKNHQYLTKPKVKNNKKQTPSDLYEKGLISIQEYGDLMFPELKERREKDMATYPLPEPLDKCVVCNVEETANIKCLECNHKACKDCVYREFTTHPSRRPFLLMHSMFCCKRGVPIRGHVSSRKKSRSCNKDDSCSLTIFHPPRAFPFPLPKDATYEKVPPKLLRSTPKHFGRLTKGSAFLVLGRRARCQPVGRSIAARTAHTSSLRARHSIPSPLPYSHAPSPQKHETTLTPDELKPKPTSALPPPHQGQCLCVCTD